ncbi:MAG TPA: AAA family ATPase [Candidatus Nanoarchaeia archaeon]|nr:AAA family ATPase [Candidatus Nanoarchaeia archaeon]
MTKFIAFVSGKGGVGKTTSSLNVGQSLASMGKEVILVDANIVTPNLAIQLGFVNPEGTLNKFLRKEKSLKEITYLHESGISLIPASPSLSEYQKTNPQKLNKLFDLLKNTADFVLIDAPSGLGYDVHQILKSTDEVVLVVNPTLSSVMDALKTIQLAKENNNTVSGIILNMTNGGKDELTQKEVESILEYPLLANVKYHRKVRRATHKQMPLTYLYPRSKPAREFKKVAQHLALGH